MSSFDMLNNDLMIKILYSTTANATSISEAQLVVGA